MNHLLLLLSQVKTRVSYMKRRIWIFNIRSDRKRLSFKFIPFFNFEDVLPNWLLFELQFGYLNRCGVIEYSF